MSKVSSMNQNKSMVKTRSALKPSETKEIAKGKHQCKASRFLTEDKENTPPVFTRSKSRILKSVNNNSESLPSVKTEKQENKTEVGGKFRRTALKPVKEKPVKQETKNVLMTPSVSPIHRPKRIFNPGNHDLSNTLLPFQETEMYSPASSTMLPVEENNDDFASVSHILFKRRSSNTIDKEACMLTSANPPSDYWKMLSEQRLDAIEKTLHQNELMTDQLSVLEAENSLLKEMVKNAEEMIMNIHVKL